MRSVLLVVLLAACATPPELTPGESVRGCWISRGDAETTTIRWLPDSSTPGRLRGDLFVYGASGPGGRQQYTLQELPEGWTFCDLAEGITPACRLVAMGHEGDLGDGRVFIDAHRDKLRIALAEPTGERIVFEGARDGCD